MSWEPIGFWGCERRGWLDLWNNARTVAYVVNNSPQVEWLGPGSFQPDITSIMATQTVPSTVPSVKAPFTNPVDDLAWWYDIGEPASGGFLGMQVTMFDGLESNVIEQTSDTLLDHNQTIRWRPPANKGYTITVEANLYGMSCCAVAYGLEVLRKKLAGCCTDESCSGTDLRIIQSIPSYGFSPTGAWTPPSVSTVNPFRTLHNVRMISQPSVIDGSGISCGACQCSPITQITFTLRCQGEKYRDAVPILYQQQLNAGACDIICSPVCGTPPDLIHDPSISVNPYPTAPNPILSVPPPIVAQQYQVVTMPARDFDAEVEFDLFAGSLPLYGVTVKAWPYNPSVAAVSGLYNECNVCLGFAVAYVAAGGTYRRRLCAGLSVTKPPYRQNARGTLLDWRWTSPNPVMRFPGGQWLLSIETDSSAAPDATISLNAVVVEP